MSHPDFISGLKDIAPRYDAMLCDAWGVIHNGVDITPGVADALIRFREQRGPVIILTNAPRPSSIIPAQLDRLGLPRAAYDGVVTSGDATRHEIARRLPAPVFRIGPDKDEALFKGLDLNFATLDEAAFIICTGLEDDQREHPNDYRDLLQKAAVRGLVMICANPDIVVNWGGRMVWCAGALADIYRDLGGDVIYGGKPHAPIYELALARIENARNETPARGRILAVGDGINTDILGANGAGIDALFVTGAGGIHSGGSDDAVAQLEAAGARAIAVAERLAW